MTYEVWVSFSGTVAAFAYLPEAMKIFRNKSVRDISLLTFGIWGVFEVSWFIYGVKIDNLPIMLANGVGSVGAVTVLLLYFHYRISRAGAENREGTD